MKNNNGFQNQVIDSDRTGRERFPLPYDVYTTTEIGEVQCTGVTPLQAGSKTTFKSRDVIRMLPMICPTLGRLKMKTWHHFVGMSDLIRSWSALLTKQVIGAGGNSMFFRPVELPHMKLNELSAMCLVGCHASVYVFQSDEEVGDTDADGDRSKWHLYPYNASIGDATFLALRNYLTSNTLFSSNDVSIPDAYPNYEGRWLDLGYLTQGALNGVKVPCNNQDWEEFLDNVDTDIGADPFEPVPLDTADKVFRINNGDYKYAVAVRYSAFGKRFRKMLLGAGYQDNFDDDTDVEVMALVAVWKAYFDTFGLTYWNSWESSFAKILCQRFDNGGNPLLHVAPEIAANSVTIRFLIDLANTYYTEDKDYIAAHTTEDAAKVTSAIGSWDKNRGWLNNIVLDTPGSTNGVSGIAQTMTGMPDSDVPMSATRHVFINRTNHTEVDAELLKILYKWTNRETAAGRRIAELLKAAGYGKYVDEQTTNFIGYEEIELDVTDVNVTADSQNVVAGKNSVAGEYVGKGVGVKTAKDAKTFSFENQEFGYWVTLSVVVCDAGYSQGVEQYHRALDADHLYSRAMDGMGKELEPMNVLIGNVDWHNQQVNNAQFKKSFGMVPRHSLWKVKKNILNGDYSLRGGRDYFLPYSLDKWLDVGDRKCELVPNAGLTYRAIKKLEVSDLPLAGQAWRFLNRYPWLANFERIFTYFGSDIQKFLRLLSDVKGLARWEYCHQCEDHFNIQMLCDLECYAPMLPIAESYGTTDDNDGHGDYTIKAS